MHPLRRILLPVAVAFFVTWISWLFLAPIFKYVGWLLPFLAVGAGIGVFLWRFPAEQLLRFFNNPVARKAGIAAALTAGAGAIWLFTGWLVGDYLSPNMNLTLRGAFVLVAILLPWMAKSAVTLYKPAGISADTANAVIEGFGRARWIILVLVALSVALLPNNVFFNRSTGDPKFMYAQKENKVYWINPYEIDEKSGAKKVRKAYSPATQEELVPGTPDIAKKYFWHIPSAENVQGWLGAMLALPGKLFQPGKPAQPDDSNHSGTPAVKPPPLPEDKNGDDWLEDNEKWSEPEPPEKPPASVRPKMETEIRIPEWTEGSGCPNTSDKQTIRRWAEWRIDLALSSEEELEKCRRDPECRRAKEVLENYVNN